MDFLFWTFDLNRLFYRSPEHGIQTIIHCATEENLIEQSGFYYSDCAVQLTSENGSNMDDAYRLWEMSERMAGLTSWSREFVQNFPLMKNYNNTTVPLKTVAQKMLEKDDQRFCFLPSKQNKNHMLNVKQSQTVFLYIKMYYVDI